MEGLIQFEALLYSCPKSSGEVTHPSPIVKEKLSQMALVKQGDSTWSSCLSCIQVSYRCSRYSKNSLFHSWQNSWSIRSFCLACKVKRKLNDRFPLLSTSHMLFHLKKKLSHWFLEFPRAKQLFPILQTYCFAKKRLPHFI